MWIGPAFEEGTLRQSGAVRDAELRVWQEHEDPYAVAAQALAEDLAFDGDGLLHQLAMRPAHQLLGLAHRRGRQLVEAGADFLAVCGAVWNAPEPAKVIEAFQPILKRG